MSKPKKDTNLHIVSMNTQEPTAAKDTVPSLSGEGGYGRKPWGVLNGYVSPGENYLIEQAYSITRRDMTGDEAKLLFQYVNIHSRLPFPECDLAASRLVRPSLLQRLFGGGDKNGQRD